MSQLLQAMSEESYRNTSWPVLCLCKELQSIESWTNTDLKQRVY